MGLAGLIITRFILSRLETVGLLVEAAEVER